MKSLIMAMLTFIICGCANTPPTKSVVEKESEIVILENKATGSNSIILNVALKSFETKYLMAR